MAKQVTHTCIFVLYSAFLSADDASRVILFVPDSDRSDYINASFIDVRTILYASLTNAVLIKLFARHKLFSKCFNVPPFTFRATVRDLPTLLHKVNTAEKLSTIVHQCHLLLWFMYSVAMAQVLML